MTMVTVFVSDILKDKILVTRESARVLEEALRRAWSDRAGSTDAANLGSATIDFRGVEGVAPSFLDELLTVFELVIGPNPNHPGRSLVVVNPPTRLSSKFEAVARGHGLSVVSRSDGSWVLTPPPNAAR